MVILWIALLLKVHICYLRMHILGIWGTLKLHAGSEMCMRFVASHDVDVLMGLCSAQT